MPCMFMGDLNLTPDSALYSFIASGQLDCAANDPRNLSGQQEARAGQQAYTPSPSNRRSPHASQVNHWTSCLLSVPGVCTSLLNVFSISLCCPNVRMPHAEHCTSFSLACLLARQELNKLVYVDLDGNNDCYMLLRVPDKDALHQCSQCTSLQDLLRHKHHTLSTQNLVTTPLKT